MVTDHDVAANPRRPDLPEVLEAADCIPLKTVQELRDVVYSIVGEPKKVQSVDRVVGITEVHDDTVMDVVRQLRPFEFAEQFKLYLLLETERSGFLSDPPRK